MESITPSDLGLAAGSTADARFQITLAKPSHLDIILAFIEDARERLQTKDTDQWKNPWPNETARNSRVLRGLQDEKTWIVWDGDIPAATATITPRRNIAVWSNPACECDLSERAVFVHRLITARKYAGLGLGAQLIDWAGLRGQSLYGAKWIRIDVWRTNRALHDYYTGIGFERCGEYPNPGYPSGALFQKPVAAIREPGTWLLSEPFEPAPGDVGVGPRHHGRCWPGRPRRIRTGGHVRIAALTAVLRFPCFKLHPGLTALTSALVITAKPVEPGLREISWTYRTCAIKRDERQVISHTQR